MFRFHWLLPMLLALAPAQAWAERVYAEPANAPAPGAPAFDTLFRRLEDDELSRLDAAGIQRRLAELDRLRPPGDRHRDLLARSMRCNWGFSDHVAEALPFAEAGLAQARQERDVEAQIRFLFCRGAARAQLDTAASALADYLRAIELARRIEHSRLLADALVGRGNVRSLLGEQGRAVLDFLEAQQHYLRAGRQDDADANLLNLAIAYRRMGEFDKARDYLRQSETFANRRKDWWAQLVIRYQRAYIEEDLGRGGQALDQYRQALALARRQGSVYDEGASHLGMAYAHVVQGEYRAALDALDRAEAEFRSVGDASNQEMVDLRRGQAYAGLGEHARALAEYARAARSIESSGNLRYMAYLYEARAASRQAAGQPAGAIADLKRYIALQKQITDNNRTQQSEVLRAQFDAARRDLENTRLQAERRAQEQRLATAERVRRWQGLALVSAGVLMVLLLALVWRQLRGLRRERALALTDPLTGVANRRSIERFGVDTIARARVDGEPLVALAFDIDHFKRINDAHGHLVGDQVLERIARECAQLLRQCDLLGRMGGEEFLVVLPGLDAAAAAPIAERLRRFVAGMDFDDLAPGLRVTISIGITELRGGDADLNMLLDRADTALYRAKDRGRDRIEVEA